MFPVLVCPVFRTPLYSVLFSRNELDQYQPGLSDRPHGIIANKMDLEQAEENLQKFQEQISNEFSKDIQVFPISGKMGQNISPLLYFMREMYDKNKSD